MLGTNKIVAKMLVTLASVNLVPKLLTTLTAHQDINGGNINPQIAWVRAHGACVRSYIYRIHERKDENTRIFFALAENARYFFLLFCRVLP